LSLVAPLPICRYDASGAESSTESPEDTSQAGSIVWSHTEWMLDEHTRYTPMREL
jgi:hypothetical protein